MDAENVRFSYSAALILDIFQFPPFFHDLEFSPPAENPVYSGPASRLRIPLPVTAPACNKPAAGASAAFS